MHAFTETLLTSLTRAVHDVGVPSMPPVPVPLVSHLRASPARTFYVLG